MTVSPASFSKKFPHTKFASERDVKNSVEKGLTAQFLLQQTGDGRPPAPIDPCSSPGAKIDHCEMQYLWETIAQVLCYSLFACFKNYIKETIVPNLNSHNQKMLKNQFNVDLDDEISLVPVLPQAPSAKRLWFVLDCVRH